MRVIKRYLSAEITTSTLLVFAALLMLFSFLDLIHELGDLGRGGYRLPHIFAFVLLSVPGHVYELFPIAALIGTLFAIAQLVANSEYTVMRASGMSLVQLVWAVLRVGIPLAVATFLAGEYVAPPAERLAQTVRAASLGDTSRLMSQQFQSGFWFKEDLSFVNIRSVLANMTLLGIRIYEFDRDLRLIAIRVAESGRFIGDGRWQLENVKTTEIGAD